MTDCVILIGLPGAGKTTWFRERFASTHERVSHDLWRNTPQHDTRQLRLINDLLPRGRSLVVDNTNLTAADRAPIMAAARARGARVIGYFFDVGTRAAVARNATREGRARVPNVAIFAAAKRLDRPSRAEGFDDLHVVTLTDKGDPVVTPAPGAPPYSPTT